jgi:predicted nuclease of restriction endonuclease-like (RecB) superfamily
MPTHHGMADRSATPSRRPRAAADVPAEYAEVLDRLKAEVRAARIQAQRTVSVALLDLFWTIGAEILHQQQARGWGAKVIDRLARDLRGEFPGMRGLTRSNLYYMRAFAAAWPDRAIVPTLLGRLSWSHVRCLLDKLDDASAREWYAAEASAHGWSLAVLEHQIAIGVHSRIAAAPSNFPSQLPDSESGLAQQLTKDPYVFDFLDLSDPALERDIEQALMGRLQDTLLEFGRGFAFVGRQVHFDIDGDDFYTDLLFFHVEQLRYVVVELKIGRFKPDYAGKLGFYVAVVDDRLREPNIHSPTVGILLCASRNDSVVRYALANTTAPMAVANYTDQPGPDPVALHLPEPRELTAILNAPLAGRPGHTLAEALPDAGDADPR